MFLESLAVSTLLLQAATPGWCVPQRPPHIDVKIDMKAPRLDLTKSMQDLGQFDIDTINPYAGRPGTVVVGGLTRGAIRVSHQVQVAGARYIGNSCVWFNRVDLVIRLDPVVYVAKEFKPGTCRYDAVRAHEQKHVQVDRDMVNRYQGAYVEAVRAALKKTPVAGPAPVAQEPQLQAALAEQVRQAVTALTDRLEAERKQAQQAVDTAQEYDRVAALCPVAAQ